VSRERLLTASAVLQQTRVSTVIPYFNTWIAKWPTVQHLAEASHDDVLAVWKGLGYYSRATRLHEGAKAMIAQATGSQCPLPSSAAELQQFPGIGRYTAGAISSIAFGHAEPVLDGNVVRVLSRQLGLYRDVKDKKATDVLWDVADQLIKSVSGSKPSPTPGQWNQAMMELGSTICTPRPHCDECPIKPTCRVYSEAQALENQRHAATTIPDIEDACTLCDPLDPQDLVAATPDAAPDHERGLKKRKTAPKQTNTLSHYFSISTPNPPKPDLEAEGPADEATTPRPQKRKPPPSPPSPAHILSYCALFPQKPTKKQIPSQDCAVCMIELCLADGTRKWLVEQRPDKGMSLRSILSLSQFPREKKKRKKLTPSLLLFEKIKASSPPYGNSQTSPSPLAATLDLTLTLLLLLPPPHSSVHGASCERGYCAARMTPPTTLPRARSVSRRMRRWCMCFRI